MLQMLRKVFIFLLSMSLSSLVVFAQDAPKPEKPESPAKPAENLLRRAYSFSMAGSGGYLGIQMNEITKDNYSKYGLSSTRGVGVEKVLEDSPAEKAGLKKDDIIVSFNGESVTSMRKLSRLISEVAPDHKISMTVLRQGSEQVLNATMGTRESISFAINEGRIGALGLPGIPKFPVSPNDPRVMRIPFPEGGVRRAPLVWSMSSSRAVGVTVTTLTDQLREFFGVEKGAGLLVKSVKKDSPADKSGLKAGDVITKIDGKSVSNTYDMSRFLSLEKEGAIDLTFVRHKKSKTVKITPEKRELTTIDELNILEPRTLNK